MVVLVSFGVINRLNNNDEWQTDTKYQVLPLVLASSEVQIRVPGTTGLPVALAIFLPMWAKVLIPAEGRTLRGEFNHVLHDHRRHRFHHPHHDQQVS